MAARARTAGKRRKGLRGAHPPLPQPGGAPGLSGRRVGEILGEWQKAELRMARGYPECRDVVAEDLEDLYQETALALLTQRFVNEEHLRHALRKGLKYRAQHLHRDEHRRQEIRASPDFESVEDEDHDSTEREALVREDRLIVAEFLSELTALEQKVFWLLAEDMKYRLIANVLHVDPKDARNAERACERKRARFQVLYDTGRLCGYRATTINALQGGEATSEQLARQAFAHLERCASCRAEHHTNATRLRLSFQGQAAALLPFPALLQQLGWLARLDARIKTLQYRLAPNGLPFGPSGVRERAAALLASGGAAAKIAAGVATVAVVATGTIATHVLAPQPPAHHRASPPTPVVATPHLLTIPRTLAASTPALRAARPVTVEHRHRRATPHARDTTVVSQREPGGFAYLGVPSDGSSSNSSTPAKAASQSGGGPFSP